MKTLIRLAMFFLIFLGGLGIGFFVGQKSTEFISNGGETKVTFSTETVFPIGTVVKLKGMEEPVMIYGRNVTRSIDKTMYHYLGVFYPIGYVSNDYNIFFNQSDIAEVIYQGYENWKEKSLKKEIRNGRK